MSDTLRERIEEIIEEKLNGSGSWYKDVVKTVDAVMSEIEPLEAEVSRLRKALKIIEDHSNAM